MRTALLLTVLALAPASAFGQGPDDPSLGFVPDSDPMGHDAAATARLCQTMSGWTLMNPSPGRYFCSMRFGAAFATIAVTNDGTRMWAVTGGSEEDRLAAAWILFDGWDARMMGPISPTSYVLSAGSALMTLSLDGRSVVISILAPGSRAYREMSRLVARFRAPSSTEL